MNPNEKQIALRKAKTHKGRLHIKRQLPKLKEDPKECVFINTNNSSEIMRLVLNQFYIMRKAFSKNLSKKNQVESAFNNSDDVEYLCNKNNASLFMYTSDQKKKPMNLVMGNLFDKKLLDMFEFEVTNFIPLDYFKDVKLNFDENCKPVLVFLGEAFETDYVYDRLRKYFLDYFKQDEIKDVNISDLTRIIVFSLDEEKKLKIRNYQVDFINEYTLNKLGLDEVGPSFDLVLRKDALASDENYKAACKQPKTINTKNQKNREKSMIETRARLYLPKQNLNAMSLKNYKKMLGKKRKVNRESTEKTEKE